MAKIPENGRFFGGLRGKVKAAQSRSGLPICAVLSVAKAR